MEPENELGVIVRFAQEAEAVGFHFESISASFPDAVLLRDGQRYRVEFEYQASSFFQHKHDIRECDVIICWVDDSQECPLPILALSEAGWEQKALTLPTDVERECAYWKQRAQLAEFRLRAVTAEQERLAQLSKPEKREVFTCPQCAAEWRSQNALNAHQRSHNGHGERVRA